MALTRYQDEEFIPAKKKLNFAIGIPTLNRFDLLLPSMMMYKHDMPNAKIFIVDNGHQGITNHSSDRVTVMTQDRNIGVAASWNVLCREIYKEHAYAFILNDDVYLGRKEEEIEDLIRKRPDAPFISGMMDWCSFLMPRRTFESIGEFDEVFYPAYYEDNDYAYRMRLSGMYPFKTPLLNPLVYKASMTSQKDRSILDKIKKCKQEYIKKWGGEPEQEKFKTAYNK